jgi:hypothetical protein
MCGVRWTGCLAVVLVSGCVLSATAGAQDVAFVDVDKEVFSRSNTDKLCERSGAEKLVKRSHLAWRLIGENKAIKSHDDLRRALKLASAGGGRAEEFSDKNIAFFVSNREPFGSVPLPTLSESEQEIARQQATVTRSFGQWLRGQHKANDSFHVKSPPEAPVPTPEQYFKDPRYDIVCGKGDFDGGAGGQASAGLPKNILVRRSVADLSVGSAENKKVNGAQISFTDDAIKERQTLAIEGLVGYVFSGDSSVDRGEALARRGGSAGGGDDYWYKIIPYVYYKSTSTRPASPKDIEYTSPGVVGSLTWVSETGNLAFDLQVEASGTFDAIHDSRVYNLLARLEPTFNIGGQTLFGYPIYTAGGFFVIRPDIAAVVGQRIIEEVGTNPDLKGPSTYTTLGYDFNLLAYFNTSNPLLANLVGKYNHGYRYNSDPIDDLWFNTFSIGYILNKNTSLEFSVTKGRDLNTLQEEDMWKLTLTFKN